MRFGLSVFVAAAAAGCVMFVSSARAQWSTDASVNLPIADRINEQTQDKIVPTADGGAYISWFDNSAGGYDVYLQRIDAAGNELWPHNGILIADRSFSSTQDYDLDVDSEGNALIAFRDDRTAATPQITANRIDPDGNLLWGTLGVDLTFGDTSFVASPKIVATSDGNVVVAWTHASNTRLQKLNSSGVAQWMPEVNLFTVGSSFGASDLDASDNGSVIISLVRGFMGATYWTQKIDTNGVQLWGGGAPIQLTTIALQTANFPQFVTDGAGGAVYGWYGSSPLQCYMQRVNSAGTILFQPNGVVASTNALQRRVSPSVAFNVSTGETFLFYTETNSTQSMQAAAGQKFDAAGNRMWSDSGKLLQGLSTNARPFVNCMDFEDGAVAIWVDSAGFGQDQLLASRVDTNGDPVWGTPIVTLASQSNSKSRVVEALSADGFVIAGWADNRSGDNDIFIQNISADGELGPIAIPGDLAKPFGVVDVFDLFVLLDNWGTDGPGADLAPPLDVVDVFDLFVLLDNWG